MQIIFYKSSLEFHVVFCDDIIINLDNSFKSNDSNRSKATELVLVNKETSGPWIGATTHTHIPFIDGYFIHKDQKYISFECQPENYNDEYDYEEETPYTLWWEEEE